MANLGRPSCRWVGAVLLAGALGLLSTVAIAWTGAAAMDPQSARGVVAIDGNHLQPWLLRMDHPTGSRLIWFEKGRVYSKPGIGPPGASSTAVSCWSFAIGTRGNPRFAQAALTIPPDLQKRIETRGLLWGIAEDARGWPLPALRACIWAPLSPDAPAIFEPDGGVLLPRRGNAGLATESLASVRVLPLTPLWPGLAADVAAMGVIWWSFLTLSGMALSALRGGNRHERGLCPACGYDLRGEFGAGCSECGWNKSD